MGFDLEIKICGVTTPTDAAAVAAAGADLIGINLWPSSPRYVEGEAARAVAAAARAARAAIRVVGVFVDADPDAIVAAVASLGLDAVQLHGDEPPEVAARLAAVTRVIKALALGGPSDLDRLARFAGCGLLVDTPTARRGGSGRVGDWTLAAAAAAGARGRGAALFLAGGLTPDNVAAAIAAVGPTGVDVASGVEQAPGRKDPAKVAAFVAAARAAGEGTR